MKEFTINNAIYKTNGKNDECYTPRYVVECIIPFIPKSSVIWCPFDTKESFFVKVLKENGFKVIYSHISMGQDFYNYEPKEHWDVMISNPPFTNKKQIFERAFQLGKPFMLLMTAQWFNDAAPIDLYMKYNPTGMQTIQFRNRIKYIGCNNKIPFKSIFFCNNINTFVGNLLINR